MNIDRDGNTLIHPSNNPKIVYNLSSDDVERETLLEHQFLEILICGIKCPWEGSRGATNRRGKLIPHDRLIFARWDMFLQDSGLKRLYDRVTLSFILPETIVSARPLWVCTYDSPSVKGTVRPKKILIIRWIVMKICTYM